MVQEVGFIMAGRYGSKWQEWKYGWSHFHRNTKNQNKLKVGWCYKHAKPPSPQWCTSFSKAAPPKDFITSPDSTTHGAPRVKIHDSMGDILIQTTISSIGDAFGEFSALHICSQPLASLWEVFIFSVLHAQCFVATGWSESLFRLPVYFFSWLSTFWVVVPRALSISTSPTSWSCLCPPDKTNWFCSDSPRLTAIHEVQKADVPGYPHCSFLPPRDHSPGLLCKIWAKLFHTHLSSFLYSGLREQVQPQLHLEM